MQPDQRRELWLQAHENNRLQLCQTRRAQSADVCNIRGNHTQLQASRGRLGLGELHSGPCLSTARNYNVKWHRVYKVLLNRTWDDCSVKGLNYRISSMNLCTTRQHTTQNHRWFTPPSCPFLGVRTLLAKLLEWSSCSSENRAGGRTRKALGAGQFQTPHKRSQPNDAPWQRRV